MCDCYIEYQLKLQPVKITIVTRSIAFSFNSIQEHSGGMGPRGVGEGAERWRIWGGGSRRNVSLSTVEVSLWFWGTIHGNQISSGLVEKISVKYHDDLQQASSVKRKLRNLYMRSIENLEIHRFCLGLSERQLRREVPSLSTSIHSRSSKTRYRSQKSPATARFLSRKDPGGSSR